MKNIVAIIGSARKGQTYGAVQLFEEELKKYEEVRVEYIMLSKIGLKDCLGCHNCINRGKEFCHESEKVKELQDKIMKADGVILATPVYNQHVTAIMKKFMDYLTFLWHRPEMFGIKFIGVSSGGGMFTPTFKYMKMNVENWGGVWVDGVGVPHYESLTEKFRVKTDRDINKKAMKFVKAMAVKELPKPSFGKLMWFNMWKMNAVAAKADTVKDYEHWTETNWFGMDYYYDTKLNPIQKAAVKVVTMLMRSMMRKVYKGY